MWFRGVLLPHPTRGASHRLGAGRDPKIPSLSGRLMGTFHRGDSKAKVVSFLDRQPIKQLRRAWGTGKQARQNNEAYSWSRRPGRVCEQQQEKVGQLGELLS